MQHCKVPAELECLSILDCDILLLGERWVVAEGWVGVSTAWKKHIPLTLTQTLTQTPNTNLMLTLALT